LLFRTDGYEEGRQMESTPRTTAPVLEKAYQMANQRPI
jgi:hypothetical protein